MDLCINCSYHLALCSKEMYYLAQVSVPHMFYVGFSKYETGFTSIQFKPFVYVRYPLAAVVGRE